MSKKIDEGYERLFNAVSYLLNNGETFDDILQAVGEQLDIMALAVAMENGVFVMATSDADDYVLENMIGCLEDTLNRYIDLGRYDTEEDANIPPLYLTLLKGGKDNADKSDEQADTAEQD